MKTFILLCFSLFLLSLNISSQDYPSSIGPAPKVDNYMPGLEMLKSANPNSRSFLWNNFGISSGTFNKSFLNSCALTLVNSTTFTPGGSTFAGSTLYTVNSISPYQLYTVDTSTGVHTLVANVTNVPNTITGMAWDHTTGTMYAVVTSCAASQLATINITTGAMTMIGSPQAIAACVSALACNPAGMLFAIDIVTDNLYRFNKITGVATLVGPVGVNLSPQSDMQFDMIDSLLYLINDNQLRLYSGGLICTFTGSAVTAFAIKPGSLTGITPIDVIPDEYFIAQNYPNPFNPSTKIKFGLPKNNNVKLTVYDILGREIAVLVNEYKQANTYEVDFEGTNLPSGVYLYKLESRDFTQTKKMLLIK